MSASPDDLLRRLGIDLPIVQAGMGGGVAGHELAAAVSEAGGLGTIGILPSRSLRAELDAARRLTSRPIAVNLLLPFARRAHWRVAAAADAVVTFWGRPRRRTANVWLHQAGSVAEARAAQAAGADGVILQGVEAGGHVRAATRGGELFEHARSELRAGYPLLLAGGIADGADVARALAAGARAAVLGTRFLASEESGAHPAYKQRVVEATETRLTELFGAGWPAPHRVLPNGATERWCARDPLGPAAVRALNRVGAPLLARLPAAAATRMLAAQRPGLPLYGPSPALRGMAERTLEVTPLYAGETAARIADTRPAARLVDDLAAGL